MLGTEARRGPQVEGGEMRHYKFDQVPSSSERIFHSKLKSREEGQGKVTSRRESRKQVTSSDGHLAVWSCVDAWSGS